MGNTRLYTGREYDREITLYYNRARYYDLSLGRFISRDPIGMRDNVNLYTYVANSPIGYKDPNGLMAKEALINAGYYVGSFGYELIDNQDFGLIERNLGIYQLDNLTNAELTGKNDADTVSRNLNALLILAGVSGQIGGNTTIVIGFSSCIPSAGGGCVMSAAGFAVDVVSAGVAGYGSSAELYMLSKSNGGGGGNSVREYKKPKSGVSGKERANDTPSGANGQRPYVGENGKEFAKRAMDQNYGKGNWETNSDRLKEFSQIKKYGDRNFENP